MKPKYIIGLIIITAAFSYLVWTSFRASFQFSVTPSEFLDARAEYVDRSVRVAGTVMEGSMAAIGTDYRFAITDGNRALNVHYKGMVPNTFREGAEVVVTGKFTDGIFEASQVLAKCASKYK